MKEGIVLIVRVWISLECQYSLVVGRGAGTFSEEGGQESDQRDTPIFLLCPPYF